MVAVAVLCESEHKVLMNCPGCLLTHAININPNGPSPRWRFNNDLEKPTFTPSLVVRYKWGDEDETNVCHSFIRDGNWEFLADCTHALAGQTVPAIAL